MSVEPLEQTPPVCLSCGNPKTFSGQGKNAGWRCRPCSKARSKESGSLALSDSKKRLKNFDAKKELLAKFGSSCNMCGYHKHQSALEFHHINPANKKFSISTKRRVSLTEEVLAEADKCILLCSNCHRHVHSENCDTPEYQYKLFSLRDAARAKSKGWWSRFKHFFFNNS